MNLLLKPMLALVILSTSAYLFSTSAIADGFQLDGSSSRIGFQLEPGGKLISPIGQEINLKPSKPYTQLHAKYKKGSWEIELNNLSGDHAMIHFNLGDFGLTVDETSKGHEAAHFTLAADAKLSETLRIWSTNVDPLPSKGKVAEIRDQGRSLAIVELPSHKVVQQATIGTPGGIRVTLVAGRYLVATSNGADTFKAGDHFSGSGNGSQLMLDLSNYLLADAQQTEYCSWAVVKPGYAQSSTRLPLANLIRDFVKAEDHVLP